MTRMERNGRQRALPPRGMPDTCQASTEDGVAVPECTTRLRGTDAKDEQGSDTAAAPSCSFSQIQRRRLCTSSPGECSSHYRARINAATERARGTLARAPPVAQHCIPHAQDSTRTKRVLSALPGPFYIREARPCRPLSTRTCWCSLLSACGQGQLPLPLERANE